MNNQQNRVEWKMYRIFSDDATGLAVRVMTLPLNSPKFSLNLGRMSTKEGEDPHFVPNLPVVAKVEAFQVLAKPIDVLVLGRLIVQAESLCFEILQGLEDTAQARKEAKEMKGAVPVVKTAKKWVSAGKTARDKAKTRDPELKTNTPKICQAMKNR